MIDPKLIRNNPEFVKNALALRGESGDSIDMFLKLDKEWREIKERGDRVRAGRNAINREIASKRKNGENDLKELIGKSRDASRKIEEAEARLKEIEKERMDVLLRIPNIPSETTPKGEDERDNVEIRKWGEPKVFSEDVVPHYEIPYMDFRRGSEISGHRFTYLKGWMATLEREIIHFMRHFQISRGYTEIATPYMVRREIITATGQLPKFEEDLYKCRDDDLWIIPTAEVSLMGMYYNTILDESELPVKMCAYSPCFRREAGAYGKDIKGYIRQHQFDKVELVKITSPEESYRELETLTRDAEELLKQFGIPFRTIELCTGDLGFSAAKTYDIEIWIPSQNRYREVSSCSNCTDFQARRGKIRFRRKGENLFVHSLNGSGVAVPRLMVAILEYFQNEDVIEIPKVLRDRMGADEVPLR